MATSSITKEFSFNTKEEVDALFEAIERSAQQQGIDLDDDGKQVAEIINRFGAHENLHEQQKDKSNFEHADDLADIFPWLERGQYIRVAE